MSPKTRKIGKISGNLRIDPDTMEEEEADTPDQLSLWLEEVVNDDDFYEDIVEMVQDWEEQIEPLYRLGMKKTGEVTDKLSTNPDEPPFEFTAYILGITREEWDKRGE